MSTKGTAEARQYLLAHNVEASLKQAIDRVHRIGQAYPVRVKRFLMQETVEDRILLLQAKKTALVGAALGSRSSTEARAMRVEDLKMLFST